MYIVLTLGKNCIHFLFFLYFRRSIVQFNGIILYFSTTLPPIPTPPPPPSQQKNLPEVIMLHQPLSTPFYKKLPFYHASFYLTCCACRLNFWSSEESYPLPCFLPHSLLCLESIKKFSFPTLSKLLNNNILYIYFNASLFEKLFFSNSFLMYRQCYEILYLLSSHD